MVFRGRCWVVGWITPSIIAPVDSAGLSTSESLGNSSAWCAMILKLANQSHVFNMAVTHICGKSSLKSTWRRQCFSASSSNWITPASTNFTTVAWVPGVGAVKDCCHASCHWASQLEVLWLYYRSDARWSMNWYDCSCYESTANTVLSPSGYILFWHPQAAIMVGKFQPKGQGGNILDLLDDFSRFAS